MVESGSKYRLVLYVCGRTPASELAVANVCRMFATEEIAHYDLQIIDVLERPDLAEKERIMATPSLVREEPGPRDILIGDLSHMSSLRTFLGILGRSGEST